MLWRDEAVVLKYLVGDNVEYSNKINYFKNAYVLYIDDFLKTKKGEMPTAADINLAFEILNYRYNNKKLITIISSERTIDEFSDIYESVGGRIYQKTMLHYINIDIDKNKNYRLR